MLKHLQCSLANLRWSWVQDLEGDLHRLRYLFWEATRRCNLSCRHCGSDCGKDDDQTGLPAELVIATLSAIAKHYAAPEIMLVTTGGEPLVRRDLLEVLGEARRLGFQLGMVSNGHILDGAMAQKLSEVGLQSIVVSLDGPEPSHDWLRDRPGSFRRACRAIAALVEVGMPVVEAITCVTPRSLVELDATYRIVRELGATHWRVFNIFPTGRAKGDDELLLDHDGIRRLVHEIAALRERGKRDGLIVNLSEEGYLGWDWEHKVRDTPYFCRAGVNIAGIMADGSIAACPNLPRSMAQGNVEEDDFVDVWENRYQLFRDRSWTREGSCGSCKQWSVCRGGSLHLWDPERKAPHWCHYEIMHP